MEDFFGLYKYCKETERLSGIYVLIIICENNSLFWHGDFDLGLYNVDSVSFVGSVSKHLCV